MLNHYTVPDRTRVVVAVELRAEDVLKEFLDLWLSCSDGQDYDWIVYRVCGSGWLDAKFAVWIGRKATRTLAE